MAFVSNMSDEEKIDPTLAPQGAVAPVGGGTGAVRLSPSLAGSTTGPAASGATGSGPTPAGGQFGSLNQYLTANQGQAEPLAGKLTAPVEQQYNTLQGQNATTLGDINKQVASNAVSNPNDTIAQESANPVSFANNPGNIASFQKLLNASYSGPASAESTPGFAAQQNAINSAISSGKQSTQTEAGRENLLAQHEATPTTGVTALNSAILSQSPTALKSVETAYNPFANLLSGLNTGAQDINQKIASTQSDTSAANAAANKAISDQTNALNTEVQGNLTAANTGNANVTNQYNDLVNTLGVGTNILSPEQQATLGIDQNQANALRQQAKLANESQYMTGRNFGAPSATTNIDNTAFLKQFTPPTAPTANQVATPEQFQRLMSLLALNNGQLPQGAVLDPTQAAQAGTYTAPTLNGMFDYNAALANATTTQQQQRADAQNQANTLTAQADAAHAASKKGGFANTIKNAINNPGVVLNPNQLNTIKLATQGKVPTGDNPLPNKAELRKLGVKS